MTYDLAGLRLSVHNRIPQVFVVSLYGRLAAAAGDGFFEYRADEKGMDSSLRLFVNTSRIGSEIDFDDSPMARWILSNRCARRSGCRSLPQIALAVTCSSAPWVDSSSASVVR